MITFAEVQVEAIEPDSKTGRLGEWALRARIPSPDAGDDLVAALLSNEPIAIAFPYRGRARTGLAFVDEVVGDDCHLRGTGPIYPW